MKTFQQPLSAEEEAYYLQLMRGGSSESAALAKDILVERNLRLVAHVAKKYTNMYDDMDDLISIGTIGLIKAIQTYKDEKGSRLATYAARCIDNELLMMFRARKKISREISLYEPIGTDKEGNEINLLDICEQEQPDIIEQMDFSAKAKALGKLLFQVLNNREREIIMLRYGICVQEAEKDCISPVIACRTHEEMTQREIGRMLNISRSYVSRIEKRALQKLRTGLLEQGFRE